MQGGGDVDAVFDYKQETPLYVAVKRGDSVLSRLLLEKGADVNHKERIYGNTPLYEAVCQGNTPNREDIVALLLSAEDIDIDIPNSNRITPPRSAILYRNFYDNENIIRMLEDHAAGRTQRHGQDAQQE